MTAPEKSSNFYLAFLFLSPRRREALSAVYAYCRGIDDIVDSGERGESEARAQLARWREEIGRLYAGEPTHEVTRRLLPFVSEFELPEEAFRELITGMEMDLDKLRYESFEELKAYLFGAAGTVGLLCVNIFGYRHTTAAAVRQYALAMGNGMQLTNILRDVGSDLELGRVYLPGEDIREAGYSVEELLQRRHTPAFERLMERECRRAEGFFREARETLHPKDRAAMLPGDIMARVYEDVLARIRAEEFHVFFQRVRVPGWRKALLASQAWLAARTLIS